MSLERDTIAAIATAPGRGGVGIVRVSGPVAAAIATAVLGRAITPRLAFYGNFLDAQGDALDQGIALYFPGPNSFTGEDVLELHGHGGQVVLDLLLRRCLTLGARLARPGEFSQRAFLNDKLDLAQAEAIADLIEAGTEQAARGALRSLQGAFSRRVEALTEALIALRIQIEAAIDFPEEEIDFLSDGRLLALFDGVRDALRQTLREAGRGALLRDGMRIVIAGRPNAGKSSLLNALAGRDSAIVTDIPGTTRDLLQEQLQIDGMPLHVTDTAGLRETDNPVERIGVERALKAIQEADRVLLVVDGTTLPAVTPETTPETLWAEFFPHQAPPARVTLIHNKSDLSGEPITLVENESGAVISLSARSGEGVDLLRQHLKDCMGLQQGSEGAFSARRRHLDALERAARHLQNGRQQLAESAAGELAAEDLRQAQQALGEITGAFSADDLLGRIFSSFCIGK